MSDSTEGTLAIPAENLLDPVGWRERTAGALEALRRRFDVEVAERRKQRAEHVPEKGPLSQSDVAPLVRDVFGVSEELRHIAAGFKETADYLDGVVQEEVEAVVDDHNYGRIVVGDLGTDVIAGWSRAGETIIDPDEVDQGLAAVYTKRLVERGEDPDVAALLADAYREAFGDIRAHGKIEYSSTKLNGLVRALQGTGDDDVAGMVERSMRKAKKDPKFTVKREEQKEKRR